MRWRSSGSTGSGATRRRSRAEGPPGPARPRLGQPRPPHLPLLPRALRAAASACCERSASTAASGSTPATRRAGARRCWSSPSAGIVIFADVDLTPDELTGDFATTRARRAGAARHRRPLVRAARRVVPAGRHAPPRRPVRLRLAARRPRRTRDQHMKPFTDFPHLRQAFTDGERWPVDRERLDALVAAGHLERGQAEEFAARGRQARTWRTSSAATASRASTNATCRPPCGPPTPVILQTDPIPRVLH